MGRLKIDIHTHIHTHIHNPFNFAPSGFFIAVSVLANVIETIPCSMGGEDPLPVVETDHVFYHPLPSFPSRSLAIESEDKVLYERVVLEFYRCFWCILLVFWCLYRYFLVFYYFFGCLFFNQFSRFFFVCFRSNVFSEAFFK